MSRKILIATPVDGGDVYSARVTVGYSEAVRMFVMQNGATVLPAALFFTCDIVRARNRAAAYVLREHPEVTHVLWWDDDVIPSDLLVVDMMLATGEDMIAAPYTTKGRRTGWTHRPLDTAVMRALADQAVAVHAVGFGFTLTSRACLERVAAAAETYTDCLSDGREVETPDMFGQVFDAHASGKRMKLSEDYSFCKRWRDLGGRVCVYNGPRNLLGHVGTKIYDAHDMGAA